MVYRAGLPTVYRAGLPMLCQEAVLPMLCQEAGLPTVMYRAGLLTVLYRAGLPTLCSGLVYPRYVPGRVRSSGVNPGRLPSQLLPGQVTLTVVTRAGMYLRC